MSRYETGSGNIQNCSGRFDRIIEVILVMLYGFMPLALGGVRAWAKEAAIFAAGAALVFLLLSKLFFNGGKVTRTWAYAPAIIFTTIVIIQLIPWPTKITAFMSPNTAALKSRLLGDLENASAALKTMTFSFYSNATRHDLRLLFAAGALFFVVVNYCNSIKKIERILTAIACIGGIIALTAFLQNIFGNDKIYWFIEPQSGNALSGPFVNHNHYGQFMNLSIGAAIGIILAELNKNIPSLKRTTPEVSEYLGSRRARKFWFMVVIIGAGSATVFTSLTRGGMLSMLAAAFFIALIAAGRKAQYGRIMTVIGLFTFACIVYTSFDAVYDRFATLWNIDPYQDRLQIVKDLTVNFRRFPVLGTGMGTHSVVYPMIDSSNLTTLCTHAENEYAQVMEETGAAGLVTLAVFGIFVGMAFYKNIRSRNTTAAAFSYGAGFGLTAILIHSLSDFGQHIPANTFLSVTYCGILLGLANIKQNERPAITTNRFKMLRTAVVLGCGGIWIWALAGADNARRSYADWNNVRDIEKQLIENNRQGTDEQYDRLISSANKAITAEKDNAIYRYWYNVYRWRNICRKIDNNWIIFPQESMPVIEDIVKELDKVRELCPTFGPAYCVQGQIENNILGKEGAVEKIRKGFVLAPCDPIACFVAGVADIEKDNINESVEKLKKAVELRENIFPDVAEIYVVKINRPEGAIDIAGDNIQRLEYLKQKLSHDKELENYSKQVELRLTEVLEKECALPNASTGALLSLANIYRQQEDKKTLAAELYRRALSVDYAAVDWRLRLAKVLAETGKTAEAMQEARICLKLQPQSKEAEKLLGELSVQNSR